MESKLTKLLAPLERDEQSLMKLDAIFAVRKLLRCLEFQILLPDPRPTHTPPIGNFSFIVVLCAQHVVSKLNAMVVHCVVAFIF